MTGWEIRQALRLILSHPDTAIETGLTWLDPEELSRLYGLLRRMDQQRQVREASRVHGRLPETGRPHPANQERAR